jgi:hypothetical protein
MQKRPGAVAPGRLHSKRNYFGLLAAALAFALDLAAMSLDGVCAWALTLPALLEAVAVLTSPLAVMPPVLAVAPVVLEPETPVVPGIGVTPPLLAVAIPTLPVAAAALAWEFAAALFMPVLAGAVEGVETEPVAFTPEPMEPVATPEVPPAAPPSWANAGVPTRTALQSSAEAKTVLTGFFMMYS